MTLRVSSTQGGCISSQLATALELLEGDSIPESALEFSRYCAFDAESADEFRIWYLRSQVFSKFDGSDGEEDVARKTDAAFSAYLDSENECRLTNGRLVGWESRARVNVKLIQKARAIVARILGPFRWEEFPAACAFGPGASSGIARRRACHQNKWELSTHITEEALPYHQAFVKWAGADLPLPRLVTIVEGNRVTTVPKDWRKRRVIAIEPDWNMFYQKGIGTMVRRRLQRWKQLLPDAQQSNRESARFGSSTGRLATLDLKAASDHVSLALSEAILPGDWFKVILGLRSPEGVVGDEVITYEKLSSMGNGNTFELESLIFYGLTLAASKKENWHYVRAYGDDIICHTSDADAVTDLLAQCGFKTNDEKSFKVGPFRESCGGHYWYGEDVSPFYLRRNPQHVGDLVNLGNEILSFQVRRGQPDFGEFDPVYRQIRRWVPKQLRGPLGLPGCLWREWDESTPRWYRDHQCYHQQVVTQSDTRTDFGVRSGAYLHKLWMNVPELEASWVTKAGGIWRTSRVSVDREQWVQLPVRLA